MSSIGKSIETKNWLVVARGWGKGRVGMTSTGYGVSFWTDENVLLYSGDSCMTLRVY